MKNRMSMSTICCSGKKTRKLIDIWEDQWGTIPVMKLRPYQKIYMDFERDPDNKDYEVGNGISAGYEIIKNDALGIHVRLDGESYYETFSRSRVTIESVRNKANINIKLNTIWIEGGIMVSSTWDFGHPNIEDLSTDYEWNQIQKGITEIQPMGIYKDRTGNEVINTLVAGEDVYIQFWFWEQKAFEVNQILHNINHPEVKVWILEVIKNNKNTVYEYKVKLINTDDSIRIKINPLDGWSNEVKE